MSCDRTDSGLLFRSNLCRRGLLRQLSRVLEHGLRRVAYGAPSLVVCECEVDESRNQEKYQQDDQEHHVPAVLRIHILLTVGAILVSHASSDKYACISKCRGQ